MAKGRDMARNLGTTSLRRKQRGGNLMSDYDRLPPHLRTWVASAVLPWGVKSVCTAYDRALTRTGDRDLALAELDAMQRRLIAKDATRVWGQTHPEANTATP
ncbi:DUF6525 family protein [Jannaschia sp. AI_61]|nr:DUF6525 family protein [Jannaschia sp. AI_61]